MKMLREPTLKTGLTSSKDYNPGNLNFANGMCTLADMAYDNTNPSKFVSLTLEDNQQLKVKLDALALDGAITADRLSEYMLLYRDMKARYFYAESKCNELEKSKVMELEKLGEELSRLRKANERHGIETERLRGETETLKNIISTHEFGTESQKILREGMTNNLEFKPVYRSPQEMMRTRFDILSCLPIPEDLPLDILKPVGIPERFTLHEFLLGSASGSLKNALTGYCAFTENTTMWCPEREEHGFYLTPLYRCDTGPRSNVIHRWFKVDIKARMPKPTECFYKKEGDWYYTGTYKSLRLEDLTPKEFDNLSQETRDALVKETLSGRKNVTPQIIFETSQLYAAGALKVAVVGIQCIGFNRMLYSVALQQAQRFQSHARNKAALTGDTS